MHLWRGAFEFHKTKLSGVSFQYSPNSKQTYEKML